MRAGLLSSRPLRWAAWAAPVAVFGLLVWRSDWERLAGLLGSSRAGLVAAAALAALASTAAQAASWRRLLCAQGWRRWPGRRSFGRACWWPWGL